MEVWPADQTVFQLVDKVKAKHHPRLTDANIAVSIADNKVLLALRGGYFSEHVTKGNRKFMEKYCKSVNPKK